ncbi:MAG: GspH/FimT family protein [Gammaproteobacteria bacterium]|nr:GspH/FimT family protein [Gammaproteobacteria bacterium]
MRIPSLPTPLPNCVEERGAISSGFTLIELLVVLLIISLSFTFAMVSFGSFGTKREAKMAAEKLQHVMSYLREQAILDSSELSMMFTQTGYSASQSGAHPPLPSFTTGAFPSHLSIHFRPVSTRLTVQFHASGAMTPFAIDIGTRANPTLVQLSGKANGTLQLS